ncbi:MAG TPA: hypothetical protein VN519_01365 [Bryobacteraceae bacterium]|nr:hypothetical protein [Bryobacteraceae bacterium]
MHRQTIGEWILGRLMTQDHAAAIVGDLEENGVSHMRFWLAIASNVIHSISRATAMAAVKGCLVQFAFTLLLSPVVTVAFYFLPLRYFLWIGAISILPVQIFTAFWITRQKQKQPLLICLMIVLIDCALGLLKINNVSINMAIWSIPLLLATIAIDRRNRQKSIA